MRKRAKELVENLSMMPHPEGGYFAEIYRSEELIARNCLPDRYNGIRCYSTSIFFLLESNECSKLHRLKSDEIWHFYEGDPLTLVTLSPDRKIHRNILGSDIANGEKIQHLVSRNSWMGAYSDNKDGYTLVGCTVAPGFEFDDFELADKEFLKTLFPDSVELIEKLT